MWMGAEASEAPLRETYDAPRGEAETYKAPPGMYEAICTS
jgi:hypothetical protein